MSLNKISINDTTTVNTGIVYDISKAHGGATYTDLTDALGTDGINVPLEIREGGMSVKFIQTNDNKYVQYRLMATSFSTIESDWQGVDDVPTDGSDNLVKSGGVANKISGLEEKISEISKEVIETEEESIVIEYNNGNEVFRLDENGLDAKNVKSNGKDVLTEHQDISGLATKEEVEKKQDAIPATNEDSTDEKESIIIFNSKGEYVAEIDENGVRAKLIHTPLKVQCWGDSITHAGKYENAIASTLGLTNDKVRNFGLSSDFSMHVRNRFVSYFTETNPSNVYRGNYTKADAKVEYSVPSYADRMIELKDSFFVFWLGTNNLIYYNRQQSGSYTTDSSVFSELQPEYNYKYDRLYAKSYVSMMYNDIKEMIALLPHENFAIIGGHGAFTEDTQAKKDMERLDSMLLSTYPRNFVDIKKLLIMYSPIKRKITASFIKPSVGVSVTINIDKVTDISVNDYICVGTRDYFDKYKVDSINGYSLDCTLEESGTLWEVNETIKTSYLLVSDLGRDAVDVPTEVYLFKDIERYKMIENPWSIGKDVHFTDEGYAIIGESIAKEILKINK